HDQALYKEAGGGPTPWHQDQFYWPLDTTDTITMWMPLVDVPLEKGALTFASGSHKDGNVCPAEISDASEAMINEIVAQKGYPIAVDNMKAGDATFHSGWTLHKAPGNQTDTLREVMTIIYFADGARCTTPSSKFQQADLETWMPGCKPGELAASELNPILYQR
ncbi:MAG: phytanoyl-CoA dioxygenase family protein, partial [Candidatus Sumerlaeaceae bacterium]